MDDIKQSEESADYLVAFAELSKRLVKIGVEVGTLTIHFASFGSWELEAMKGYEAVRFIFDGRDGCIETEVAPIQNFSLARRWKKVDTKFISGRHSEVIAYAEGFLRERFGKLSD
jgi:hypothetical protein